MNFEFEFSIKARAADVEQGSSPSGKRPVKSKSGTLSDFVGRVVNHPILPVFLREWLRQS